MQSRTAIPAEPVWVGVLNLEENPEFHDNPHICRVKEWCLPSIWGVTAAQRAVPCLMHSVSMQQPEGSFNIEVRLGLILL